MAVELAKKGVLFRNCNPGRDSLKPQILSRSEHHYPRPYRIKAAVCSRGDPQGSGLSHSSGAHRIRRRVRLRRRSSRSRQRGESRRTHLRPHRQCWLISARLFPRSGGFSTAQQRTFGRLVDNDRLHINPDKSIHLSRRAAIDVSPTRPRHRRQQDVGVFEQQVRGNYLGAVHIIKAVAPGASLAPRHSLSHTHTQTRYPLSINLRVFPSVSSSAPSPFSVPPLFTLVISSFFSFPSYRYTPRPRSSSLPSR